MLLVQLSTESQRSSRKRGASCHPRRGSCTLAPCPGTAADKDLTVSEITELHQGDAGRRVPLGHRRGGDLQLPAVQHRPLLLQPQGQRGDPLRGDVPRPAGRPALPARRRHCWCAPRAASPCTPARGSYQLICESLARPARATSSPCWRSASGASPPRGSSTSERKKPLPLFPSRVAVVTSPTGAAIRDILRVLAPAERRRRRRDPPAPVQGDGADERIAARIETANRIGHGRRAHRGPRRRLPGGPPALLLGGRGAGHRRLAHPRDLGGRSRDRRHAGRLRRRRAGPHPVGRRGDGLRPPARSWRSRCGRWRRRSPPRSPGAWNACACSSPSSSPRTSPAPSPPSCSPCSRRSTTAATDSPVPWPTSSATGRTGSRSPPRELASCSPLDILHRGYAVVTLERTGRVLLSPKGVRRGDAIRVRLARGGLRATTEETHAGEEL